MQCRTAYRWRQDTLGNVSVGTPIRDCLNDARACAASTADPQSIASRRRFAATLRHSFSTRPAAQEHQRFRLNTPMIVERCIAPTTNDAIGGSPNRRHPNRRQIVGIRRVRSRHATRRHLLGK
jgi:hypothetical protein